MSKFFLAQLISVLILGTGFCPVSAFARPLDAELMCNADSNAHTFIGRLITDQSIEPAPIHVEADSINVFRPRHEANLTAFGLRVRVVFGYQPHDSTFKPGKGKTASGPTHGVVVFASTESVEALLRQAGSHARIQPVIPMILSAIVCDD